MDTGHPVELIFATIGTFWAFAQMFIFSDPGENVSNRFGNINDTIYYCDWYSFPIEIQRLLPTIMVSTQEAVIIQGFANLSCTRDAFKKVIFFFRVTIKNFCIKIFICFQVSNGGFSYFMMIRKMYH